MANDLRLSGLIAPAFREAHADIKAESHAEYWLKGGRGSGKSVFITQEILLGLLRHPGANAIVYRRVANTLRQSVYEEFLKSIDMLGLSPWFQARLSPLELRYKPTGQRVLFRGADDPGKSKSIALSKGYFGYLWFEELAEFDGPEDIRTIQASVLRGRAEQRPLTFMSYNPPMSQKNWVNEAALVPDPRRLVHHSTYLDLPREWLGDSLIGAAESLRQTNERAWRHMYLGEVTGTGGQVFDNVELKAVTDADIKALEHFYNGLDFGFAEDPDALTRWGWEPKARRLVAVGEFYGARNSIDALAEKAKAMCRREVVRCDSADPRMIAELRSRGVNAVGVKKGPGSRDHGFRWLQDLGCICIDPARTPNIAREFSGYEYRRDKAGNILSEYPDGDDHTIDSGRYALEPEIGKKKLGTMDKRMLGL